MTIRSSTSYANLPRSYLGFAWFHVVSKSQIPQPSATVTLSTLQISAFQAVQRCKRTLQSDETTREALGTSPWF